MERSMAKLREQNGEKLWTLGFVAISIGYFLSSVVLYTTNSTFTLYVNFLGGTASLSGLSTTLFSIANIIARLTSGHMADHYSRRGVLIMGGVTFFVPALFFAFSHSFVLLLIMRFIQGYGYAAMTTAQNTMASDVIPEKKLGEGMGYFSTAMSLSGAVGPQLALAILEENHFTRVYLFMAGAVLLSGGISLLCRVKEPRRTARSEKQMALDFVKGAIEPHAFPAGITAFVAFVSISCILTFVTLFAGERGFPHAGIFFMISAIAMAVTKIFTGRLSDRFGTLALILPSLLLGSANLILLAFARSEALFLVCGGIYGVTWASILPVLTTVSVKMSPPDRRGAAISTFFLFVDVGVGVGALIWGTVIDAAGFTAMFLGSAAVMFASAVVSLIFFRREQRGAGG